MKNKHPIQVIDLRYPVDHITPNEFNRLKNLINTGPANVNARLLVILIRHRQIEMFSDANKIIEVKVT